VAPDRRLSWCSWRWRNDDPLFVPRAWYDLSTANVPTIGAMASVHIISDNFRGWRQDGKQAEGEVAPRNSRHDEGARIVQTQNDKEADGRESCGHHHQFEAIKPVCPEIFEDKCRAPDEGKPNCEVRLVGIRGQAPSSGNAGEYDSNRGASALCTEPGAIVVLISQSSSRAHCIRIEYAFVRLTSDLTRVAALNLGKTNCRPAYPGGTGRTLLRFLLRLTRHNRPSGAQTPPLSSS
jgi:hypothetical protein